MMFLLVEKSTVKKQALGCRDSRSLPFGLVESSADDIQLFEYSDHSGRDAGVFLAGLLSERIAQRRQLLEGAPLVIIRKLDGRQAPQKPEEHVKNSASPAVDGQNGQLPKECLSCIHHRICWSQEVCYPDIVLGHSFTESVVDIDGDSAPAGLLGWAKTALGPHQILSFELAGVDAAGPQNHYRDLGAIADYGRQVYRLSLEKRNLLQTQQRVRRSLEQHPGFDSPKSANREGMLSKEIRRRILLNPEDDAEEIAVRMAGSQRGMLNSQDPS